MLNKGTAVLPVCTVTPSKNKLETIQRLKLKYKRLINKQLLQVSGLCGTPFLSYLTKSSTHIALSMEPLRGTPTWQPQIYENIWNSLLLWERLLFPPELVSIHINTSPNTWTVQTAKNHKKKPFFRRDSFATVQSWCYKWRKSRKFKTLYFKHKRCYWAGNLWKDIFLVVPSPNDDKNVASLASFDFRILWRHVQTKNIHVHSCHFHTKTALWSYNVSIYYLILKIINDSCILSITVLQNTSIANC